MFTVSQLAQKSYDREFLSKAYAQLKVIDDFLTKYDEYALEDIYARMTVERRSLITAEEVDDEEFVGFRMPPDIEHVCLLVNMYEAIYYEKGRLLSGVGIE